MEQEHTRVWPLGLRVFHMLLILCFAGAYLSGGEDDFMHLHVSLGAMLFTLVLLRIPYGIFGTRHARFRDFRLAPAELLEYGRTIFATKKDYPGHNPATSYAAVFILTLGILTPLSGYLYAIEAAEVFEEIHEVFANLFLAIALAHIAGVLFEHFYHKKGTAKYMLNGKKPRKEGDIEPSSIQQRYMLFWIGAAFVAFFLVFTQNIIPLEHEGHEHGSTEEVHEHEEHEH